MAEDQRGALARGLSAREFAWQNALLRGESKYLHNAAASGLLAVSYGTHGHCASMSIPQLADASGADEGRIRRDLNFLVEAGFLARIPRHGESSVLCLVDVEAGLPVGHTPTAACARYYPSEDWQGTPADFGRGPLANPPGKHLLPSEEEAAAGAAISGELAAQRERLVQLFVSTRQRARGVVREVDEARLAELLTPHLSLPQDQLEAGVKKLAVKAAVITKGSVQQFVVNERVKASGAAADGRLRGATVKDLDEVIFLAHAWENWVYDPTSESWRSRFEKAYKSKQVTAKWRVLVDWWDAGRGWHLDGFLVDEQAPLPTYWRWAPTPNGKPG